MFNQRRCVKVGLSVFAAGLFARQWKQLDIGVGARGLRPLAQLGMLSACALA